SMMNKVKTVLAVHLHHLFTASLESGGVPDDLRIADVTPIFKAGERTECSNYIPMSLTSVPGKLLVSIIGDRISVHLEENELIGRSQHGFLRGKSCLSNLLEFFDFILIKGNLN
ncbi:hypothetical protein, partial [Salinarimonas soli]|uniref:hypothetical protein n=1 Tax=Salinarimonas soli TaxID=1638099 RepID=UPI001AEE1BDF